MKLGVIGSGKIVKEFLPRFQQVGIEVCALLSTPRSLDTAKKLGEEYGIEVVNVTINSATASEEDQQMIKQMQATAVYKDPTMAAANLTAAQAEAMKGAANNPNAGPMMAFAGMNMATQAGGMNAGQLYSMGAAQQNAAAAQAPAGAANAADSWECPSCHKVVSGKFCPECGDVFDENDVQ